MARVVHTLPRMAKMKLHSLAEGARMVRKEVAGV
jgi:hypothetical protein